MASAKPAAKTATAAPPRVTVELRMALSLEDNPGVVRWVEGKPIALAKVSVKGTSVTATTDRNGRARLPIVAPKKGRVIEIEAAPSQVSSGPAGPSHGAAGGKAPAMQLRPFQVTVDTDAKGFVPDSAAISLTEVEGSPPHALLLDVTSDKLVVDWKPDFLKAPPTLVKIVKHKKNDFLILHRTGGLNIRNSINTFLNPKNITCIHYLVDVDGHVIKLVHEDDAVNHTGPSFFQGRTDINSTSIGIETVHGGTGPFQNAQYDTLLRLVREIVAAHPKIVRFHRLGHVEIGTEKTDHALSLSRRIGDPGDTFEWDRFEKANLVRHRIVSVAAPVVFGIGPGQFAEIVLDKKRTKITKSVLSPPTLAPDFKAIQKSLSKIGYSVATDGKKISGVFDIPLLAAVQVFQQRFFSGGNKAARAKKFRLGRLDFETAAAIDSVAQDK